MKKITHTLKRGLPGEMGLRAPNFLDMTGASFGRWKVLRINPQTSNGVMKWLCRCECGTEKVIYGHSLRSGTSTSCGCFQKEFQANRFRTHGMTGTPEHQTWLTMNQRCRNPNAPGFENYGGRGIKVCKRWRNSFESFLSDMGKRPPGKMSIHRVNNDGNYEPKNCIWADDITQHNATRSNVFYQFNGESLTLTQWSRKLGINRSTLYARVYWGVPLELAFQNRNLSGTKTNKRKEMEASAKMQCLHS